MPYLSILNFIFQGDWLCSIICHIIPTGLPVRVTSAFCQARKIINYLSDWSGTCQVALNNADSCRNHQQLRASSFYKGFRVIVSPQLMNETYADHLKEVWLNTTEYFYHVVNFISTMSYTNFVFIYRIVLLMSAFQ